MRDFTVNFSQPTNTNYGNFRQDEWIKIEPSFSIVIPELETPETRAGCPGALPHPHQDQAGQLQLPGSSSGKQKRIELNSFV